MHGLIATVLATSPVITDGAWGTQLQARGLQPGQFPDVWNLENPSKVQEVAAAYVAAGSRVILTNTFGSNPVRLGEFGLADRLQEINAAGVRISKNAASPSGCFVFASIGPTGKLLLNGDITAEEMQAAFEAQANALSQAGADALVVETMSDLEEAKIAVAAARKTGLPVVACMVFDSGREKDRTMMGNSPEQAARELSDAGADVIGANCGQGIAGFASICKRLKAATDKPIWIKANAGLPEMVAGKALYRTQPEEFAALVPPLIQAGASFVGGCCGTSPAFISAVKESLSK